MLLSAVFGISNSLRMCVKDDEEGRIAGMVLSGSKQRIFFHLMCKANAFTIDS
jgi:hypothetical protein